MTPSPIPLALALAVLASACAEAASIWSQRAPVPLARTEVAGALLKEKIYLIGGFDAEGRATNTVEIYDPRSDRWSIGPSLPVPLHHSTAVEVLGTLYIVGGFLEGWVPTNASFRLRSDTSGWDPIAPMPTARGALGIAASGGFLYAAGGFSDRDLDILERYDPKSDRWERLPPMPTPRNHLALAVASGRLFAIGGRAGRGLSNLGANEAFNPSGGQWEKRAPLPTPRSGIAAATVAERIYLFGGERSSSTFSENERYDPALDQWEKMPPLPTARHGLAAVAAFGRIYVLAGGPTPGLSVSSANEAFAPPP